MEKRGLEMRRDRLSPTHMHLPFSARHDAWMTDLMRVDSSNVNQI